MHDFDNVCLLLIRLSCQELSQNWQHHKTHSQRPGGPVETCRQTYNITACRQSQTYSMHCVNNLVHTQHIISYNIFLLINIQNVLTLRTHWCLRNCCSMSMNKTRSLPEEKHACTRLVAAWSPLSLRHSPTTPEAT